MYSYAHICTTHCPIAQSMNYIASEWISKTASANSVESLTSTHSSLCEDVKPEFPPEGNESDVECRPNSSKSSVLRTKSKHMSQIRTKTGFLLAHPPPAIKHRQKLRIRPRILLQLQRTSNAARPTPAFDVLPSVTMASGFARRFPRTFKGKTGVGADDLIIVRSEDYHTTDTEEKESDGLFEDDSWNTRDIVAVVCQPAKDEPSRTGNTEICLNQGPSWAASMLSNGAYEFESSDESGHRTIARWVPRRTCSPKQSSRMDRPTSKTEEKVFKFSILNPDSRRHAIIGTLDFDTIEVLDRYSMPSPTTSLQYSTKDSNNTATPNDGELYGSRGEQALLNVDESLRNLIVVTGIWVALREGFFRGPSHSETPALQPRTWGPATAHKRRSRSLNIKSLDENAKSPPESPLSTKSPHRRATIQHTASSSVVPDSSSINQLRTSPRRAASTGSTFVQQKQSRSLSSRTSSRLSPISSFGDSDAERESSQKRRTSLAHTFGHALSELNSCLQPRSQNSEDNLGIPTNPLATEHTQRLHKSTTSFAGATKKSERLGKIFGFKKQVICIS